MRDHLFDWWRVRDDIDWAELGTPDQEPVTGHPDGVVAYAAAGEPERAARLLAALAQVRDAAQAGAHLSLELSSRWQAIVLGVGTVGFRDGPAFAKRGREHYGLGPDTRDRFEVCLAQATEAGTPLSARAARVYLDVLFVHPFPDGNARAAMLAIYHVLVRETVIIDIAEPLLRTVRRADDRDGAVDLVRLVEVLITHTRRRSAQPRHAGLRGDAAGVACGRQRWLA